MGDDSKGDEEEDEMEDGEVSEENEGESEGLICKRGGAANAAAASVTALVAAEFSDMDGERCTRFRDDDDNGEIKGDEEKALLGRRATDDGEAIDVSEAVDA